MAISNPVLIQLLLETASASVMSNTVGAGGVPGAADIFSLLTTGEPPSAQAIADFHLGSPVNSYNIIGQDQAHAGAANIEFNFAQAPNVSPLVQNDLITWSWTTNVLARFMASFYVQGLDHNGPTNGPVTPVEFTTIGNPSSGAVATPAGDWIALGALAWQRLGNPATDSTEDAAGGWTTIAAAIEGGSGQRGVRLSYQKGSGTGGVVYAPRLDIVEPAQTGNGHIAVFVFSAAVAAGHAARRRTGGIKGAERAIGIEGMRIH